MAILSSPLALITSTPPVTRTYTAATVVLSLLYAWIRWGFKDPNVPYLTLVPGSSLFYPWTLLTSANVETSIPELFVSLLFVPPSLRYLERLWGSIETLKFIAVSVTLSNVIALGFNWIEFAATQNAELFLYGMEYHGQMALQIAILVAFTQLIPEHQVQVFGILQTRVKTLPMAYLTLSTVLTFIGLQCPYVIIQFGWLVGYVYLRFYKKNTSDTVGGGDYYGDRSETFAFVYWFPPFIHGPITILSNTVYSVATRFHLIPSQGPDIESNGYVQVPGSARAEAERRRALALKALDQRLAGSGNASSSVSSPPRPSESQPSRPPPVAIPSSEQGKGGFDLPGPGSNQN